MSLAIPMRPSRIWDSLTSLVESYKSYFSRPKLKDQKFLDIQQRYTRNTHLNADTIDDMSRDYRSLINMDRNNTISNKYRSEARKLIKYIHVEFSNKVK